MLRYLSLVLVLVFCSPRASLLAQTRNATLHGSITDPTGAVIPGASINIITPGGQTITSMTTDASGAYQSRGLAPGTYIVVANAQGFASSSSKAVILAPGQSVQYSVALQIQVEQQNIQVDADALTVIPILIIMRMRSFSRARSSMHCQTTPTNSRTNCRLWRVRQQAQTAGKFI